MANVRVASLARALAWLYLAALLASTAALRLVGEDSWLLTPVLYAPRVLFALPLAVTLPATFFSGPRWMLLTQAASFAIVLFPLMGLELHPIGPSRATAPSIRVLSYNVFFDRAGCDAVLDEVAVHDADVIVLQAARRACDRAVAARFPSFHLDVTDEFVLASRFPILDAFRPPDFPGPPQLGRGFMRYTLETPLGRIDLYSVHPYSLRHPLEPRREDPRAALLAQLGEPELPAGRQAYERNTAIRRDQVEAIKAAASYSVNPVIIAGDTNLPSLSRIYARFLAAGPWKDGFATVGNGFGYTFPSQWKYHQGPWMRLDRILAGPGLRFVSFEVGGRRASDHLPVVAEIARGL